MTDYLIHIFVSALSGTGMLVFGIHQDKIIIIMIGVFLMGMASVFMVFQTIDNVKIAEEYRNNVLQQLENESCLVIGDQILKQSLGGNDTTSRAILKKFTEKNCMFGIVDTDLMSKLIETKILEKP